MKNKKQQLKNGWRKVKLRDIGKVVTGKTPPTSQKKFYNGVYPFITPSDLESFQNWYIENTERNLSEDWRKNNEKYLLPPNSINYICIGSTVGKISLTKRESFSNQQINSLVCDEEKVDPYYCYYRLIFQTEEIQGIANARGAGKSIINKTDFENYEIETPSHSIQQKIASVLSAYDELIENNTKRIKVLEKLAQAVYNEWFVKFRFPGHEKVKMIDPPGGGQAGGTEFGNLPAGKVGIPEGWEVRKVSDFVDIKSGYSFKSKDFVNSGQYGLVTIKNVQDKNFVTECVNRLENIPDNMPDYCYLNDGDILLSLTGNIGRICLVYGENYLLNQRVAKLIPKKDIYYTYTYLFFASSFMKEKMELLANGVAQQNLSLVKIGEMKVVFPSDELVEKFELQIRSLIDKIILLQKINQNLRRTRDLLLPKLVSGEVEVK